MMTEPMPTSPVNILLVDDIAHNITALQASLERPGINLLVAGSGTAALDLLLRHDVALAILDVNMPGMNGFELAALMRGSPRTSHVPIIFLTATAQDASRTFLGYEAGAVDFLYKPFDPRILRSKVEVFVQLEQHKRQLAAQLVTTRQMLEANEMLMAVLSHDLRTPLGAVLASAEYLMRVEAGDPVSATATRIRNSALRMARMVEQLLNLARLQGGRLQLQPRAAELAALCRGVLDEFASRADAGRLALRCEGDSTGRWDVDLLWQAVSNLVSNALHHGDPHGEVVVTVDAVSAGPIRVAVNNRGVIAPDVMPQLFTAFGASGVGGRPREGLGLGLHIVREIVQMHGGEVSVSSDPDEGTTFTLMLPRAPALARAGMAGR
jgi:two-component system sensor histidine kinase/response regulator